MGEAFESSATIFESSTTMRVSRNTCPRPSSSMLAPITMRFFCVWAVAKFVCAVAQMMSMLNTQSAVVFRRRVTRAVVGHAAKLAIVEHGVFCRRNICKRNGRAGSAARISRAILPSTGQRWQAADLFCREFARPDAEIGESSRRGGIEQLGKAWRGRSSRGGHAVVFLSRGAERTDGASHWRKTGRSDLHEQSHGESSHDDGHVLSADQIALQDLDGRTGVSFRHVRDQNANRASRARSQRYAYSRATAQGRVHDPNGRRCRSYRETRRRPRCGDGRGGKLFHGPIVRHCGNYQSGAETWHHCRIRSCTCDRQCAALAS